MIARSPKARTTRRTHRQRGSAFIISLLVIIVITFLGLTLSMVTSTEMQLGSNDRDLQRSFYACNSGLAITAARILVRQDSLVPGESRTPLPMQEGRPLQINEAMGSFDATSDASPLRGSRVIVSYVVKLNEGPAALSQINNNDNKQILKRGVLGFQSWGYRYDTAQSPTPTTPDTPLSMRVCSTVLDMQPFKPPLNMDFMSSQAGATVGSRVMGVGKLPKF